MYESLFQFRERPFLAAPRADRYFPSSAAESAKSALLRCVDRAEGPAILIGPPGTGKSLLLQVLAEHFGTEYEVALLSSTRINSPRTLLQALAYELGQPFRGIDEGELRLSLVDHLSKIEDGRQGLLLLVDEAHLLPLSVLQEIRVLTNLVRRGSPRVRLVLAGNAALEERLAHPRLESFNQRLAQRCYLAALDRSECDAFVRSQIDAVHGAPDLFDDAALVRIYSATDGIPRLVNQLCDHALVLACAAGVRRIDESTIDEAWADLQQLPAPWNKQARRAAGEGAEAGIIEVGALDEDADDGPHVLEIGAAPPRHATRAARRLDEIDVHLAALDDDEFQPVAKLQPEVEFTPPEAAELLRGNYDEEEVVLDRYAQWDALRSGTRRVQSQDADAGLASLLRMIERQRAPAIAQPVVETTVASPWQAGATAVAEQTPPVAAPTATVFPNTAAAPPRTPRRPPKYSNLFSKLTQP